MFILQILVVCWITTLLDRPPYELETGHYLSSGGEGGRGKDFGYVTMKSTWSLLKLCIISLEGGEGAEKRWILVATVKFTWSLLWLFSILMIPSRWRSIFFSPPPPQNTLLAETPPCPFPRAINNYRSLWRYKSLIGQTTYPLESSLAQEEAQSSVQVHKAASRICCWVASENCMYYRM